VEIDSGYSQVAALEDSVFAHETFSSVGTRNRVGALGGGMTAQVFLLITSQICVGPVAALNVLHAFKQCRTADVHLPHDRVAQIGSIELRHLDVGKGQVGILKVGAVQRGVEEGGPHQIAALEVGIPHDALLEGHPLQILPAEIGSIKVDTPSDGDGPAGLESRGTSRRNLGIGRRGGPSIRRRGRPDRFVEDEIRHQPHGQCSHPTKILPVRFPAGAAICFGLRYRQSIHNREKKD
jgi:hypothetical protein